MDDKIGDLGPLNPDNNATGDAKANRLIPAQLN
jgi:hypothetical protein